MIERPYFRFTRPVEPAVIPPWSEQYLRYIENVGGRSTVKAFDEDWAPIGPKLRRDLSEFILEEQGILILTRAARAALGIPD